VWENSLSAYYRRVSDALFLVLHVPVSDLEQTLNDLYDEIGCEYVNNHTFKPTQSTDTSSSSGAPKRGRKSKLLVSTTFLCSFAGKPRDRRPKGDSSCCEKKNFFSLS
jgi:hypothetical protein